MKKSFRHREYRLCLFLLEEEKVMLDKKADEAGMSKSELVRNLIMYGAAHERHKFSNEYAGKILYEINRIGNNLNQIAYVANSTKHFSRDEFDKMVKSYNDLLSYYTEYMVDSEEGA
ncbi:MAG: plasmid mobilization relaxosome protein MobC [Clostridia bacterium]|jgi:hypothetical protein|nr:plasmid mobilization relaxosome protein MobC [Clostridia bacterium]